MAKKNSADREDGIGRCEGNADELSLLRGHEHMTSANDFFYFLTPSPLVHIMITKET